MDAEPQDTTDRPAGAQGQPGKPGGQEITPELVRQLADRVWRMMLLDLKVEKERVRRPPRAARGGW
jgi:hypothetical protein